MGIIFSMIFSGICFFLGTLFFRGKGIEFINIMPRGNAKRELVGKTVGIGLCVSGCVSLFVGFLSATGYGETANLVSGIWVICFLLFILYIKTSKRFINE